MFDPSSITRADMTACMLCAQPRCSAACGRLDCGGLLRSVWFANGEAAARSLPERSPCAACAAPCEAACPRQGGVPIRRLMLGLSAARDSEPLPPESEGLLQADLCGFPLENPFLLSSSVVASDYDMCARAFDMGWAGAAFKTVSFLDIHEASPRFSALKGDRGTIIGFKNIEQLSDHSVASNMETFARLKKAYPKKALIASIMGRDEAEWATLARMSQDAGADVLELNFSCPHMSAHGMGSDVGQHPELVEAFTRAARGASGLPVLAKLTPNTGSMAEAADAALRGGADGLAAINTIKSIIDVNPHTYATAPSVRGMGAVGGYSGAAVKPIALRFIAELGQWNQNKGLHISGMGGVETWRDALEFILLGAGSVQVTTAVMQYGYRIIDDLRSGLSLYMREKGFRQVRQMTGLALDSVCHPDALERDTLLYPRFLREKCVACGRCVISCRDGGHQALRPHPETGKPILDPARCVGCHLCALVCPTGAIAAARKRAKKKEMPSHLG